MAPQSVEPLFPEPAVGREPTVELPQRFGPEPVEPPLGIGADLHQPRLAQGAQMLGHGGLAEAQRVDQIVDRPLLAAEEVEDRAPIRFSQHVENHGLHIAEDDGRGRGGSVRPVTLPRLRQVAFAAADLEAVAGELQHLLGLGDPYRDEGVGLFGLHNTVFALGDTFLEVVSPTRPGTAAGRYLERQGGDCGYMAMVQIPDAAGARSRLEELGVRVVWDFAEDDIVDLHLHPRDVPGTLLALDQATPEGSWRWGGPAWQAAVHQATVPAHDDGALESLTVAVGDPAATARRWAAVLDVPADGTELALADGQSIRFIPATDRDGIVALSLSAPGRAPGSAVVAGVRIDHH